MTDQEFRIEHDTMGEVKVPAKALWRAQTSAQWRTSHLRPPAGERIGSARWVC